MEVCASVNLHNARSKKNDEFYTRYEDVSEELLNYSKYFEGKIILCNCDNPSQSAFWKYFHLNFAKLGLKKLISSHYNENGSSYKMEYEGGNDGDIMCGVITLLSGNGDFRNEECIDLLNKCDIIVTNPPFSLAREYLKTLAEHKKKFIIVGDLNWITYKDVFYIIKNNLMWFGYNRITEFLKPDGSVAKFGNKLWYTNFDIDKRHEKLTLCEPYNFEKYKKYDNYDAINVNKVSDIPYDYDGVIGVPITFMDKYCPEQFDILGFTGGIGWNSQNDVKTIFEYTDTVQHNPDGTTGSGSKVNTGAVLRYKDKPDCRYYTAGNRDGYLVRLYGRILIRIR